MIKLIAVFVDKNLSVCKMKRTKEDLLSNICVKRAFFTLLVLLSSVNANNPAIREDENFETIEYGKYESETQYNSSALLIDDEDFAGLYSITDSLINNLLPKLISDSIIVTVGHEIDIDGDWSDLLNDYIPLLVFSSFIVLFLVLVPIWGLFFFCCRCCCGPKPAQVTKGDKTKKIILITAVVILVGFFLFGIVCAFGTNEKIDDGLYSLTDHAKSCVSDASAYLKDIQGHVEFLLIINFGTMSGNVTKTLSDESGKIKATIQNSLDNISLVDIKSNVLALGADKDKLLKVIDDGNALKQLFEDFTSVLNGIRDTLTDLSIKINKLGVDVTDLNIALAGANFDLTTFPDIPTFDELNQVNTNEIMESINEGEDTIKNVSTTIDKTLSDTTETVTDAIVKAKTEIDKQSEDITILIDDQLKNLNNKSDEYLDDANNYIKDYGKYRYILDFSMSFILILIPFLMVAGLLFGLLCKTPNTNKGQFCSARVSGIFFMTCLTILFISALFLGVIILAHMAAMFAKLLVCEPLKHPESNEVLDFLDELVDLSGTKMNISLKSVVTKCYNNSTAFDVFSLETKIDLDEIENQINSFDFNKTKDDIEQQISDIDVNIELLTSTDKKNIEDLKRMPLDDLNISDKLTQTITSMKDIDMGSLNSEIQKVIDKLILIPNQPLASELEDEKNKIENIPENIKYIKEKIEVLSDDTTNLYNNLKDNFAGEIQSLLDSAVETQGEIGKLVETKNEIKVTALHMTGQLEDYVRKYLDLTVETVKSEMAPCGPLATTIKAGTSAVCDKIVQPINGFWFSLFWSSVLYIPTIIICIMLANVFRKHQNADVKIKNINRNQILAYNNNYNSGDPSVEPEQGRFNQKYFLEPARAPVNTNSTRNAYANNPANPAPAQAPVNINNNIYVELPSHYNQPSSSQNMYANDPALQNPLAINEYEQIASKYTSTDPAFNRAFSKNAEVADRFTSSDPNFNRAFSKNAEVAARYVSSDPNFNRTFGIEERQNTGRTAF